MARVDLERFMGDWYVVASIPTLLEREAYNAVESYRLAEDGSIHTTFRYRDGGFTGTLREMRPRAFVEDRRSNAVWGMQFVWPIRADYRVIHVDEGYRTAVIGRNKRDYVWIMSRSPELPAADYERLLAVVARAGYELEKLRRVPQRWPDPVSKAVEIDLQAVENPERARLAEQAEPSGARLGFSELAQETGQ